MEVVLGRIPLSESRNPSRGHRCGPGIVCHSMSCHGRARSPVLRSLSHDDQNLQRLARGEMTLSEALAQLRSRRGFDSHLAKSETLDHRPVSAVIASSTRSITHAFLLPFSPSSELGPSTVPIKPVVIDKLRLVEPASPLHLALVEVVRRQYKVTCQAIDRQDKESQAHGKRPP